MLLCSYNNKRGSYSIRTFVYYVHYVWYTYLSGQHTDCVLIVTPIKNVELQACECIEFRYSNSYQILLISQLQFFVRVPFSYVKIVLNLYKHVNAYTCTTKYHHYVCHNKYECASMCKHTSSIILKCTFYILLFVLCNNYLHLGNTGKVHHIV